ncbi:hypothetical protein TOPH_07527 [Tolypocladium ophioglossoides CBS 100239]|uniref:2EXR domain-containing protein n=1 Tax=Tolypocladium ophioglossoides (strain CBS 100239) TaxID=1163406 RepID=A0A0L0N1H6_TOLOC|nr:hypothetical protein TOPH_07527 [Tolypocladium ophioglossoides CBS 100239]
MATFYLFPRLPFELRARIWELTVEPRTVEVGFKRSKGTYGLVLHVASSTPVSAVLQACHEARNQGLYQQAFFRAIPRDLEKFFNLEEIHVICEDGLWAWQEAWECVGWPCGGENVRFIDKETGQVAEGYELDKMVNDWIASQPSE